MAALGIDWIKPLRGHRLWLALWWLAVMVVIVTCLLPAPDLPPLPQGSDKIEHVLAYFVLAASAVQLFLRSRLPVVACGLVLLGVAIEFAQGAFTATRSADVFDALADAIGVIAGMATAFTPWRDVLSKWTGRIPPVDGDHEGNRTSARRAR